MLLLVVQKSSGHQLRLVVYLGCDIGGAKEPGVIYFPTNWGAKEPQALPNQSVVIPPLFTRFYTGG